MKLIEMILQAIKNALNMQPTTVIENKEVSIIEDKIIVEDAPEVTIEIEPSLPAVETIVDKIIKLARRKQYSIFDDNSKDYNLNIWFIRSEDKQADIFNDKCIVFWKSVEGQWNTKEFKVTTDPGVFWMTKQGYKAVAILAEGQYRGTHKIDIHKRGSSSAHEALCQRLGSVKVYRDGNKDTEHNYDVPVEIGSFGINCHRPTNYSESTGKVHASSAGCMVWARRAEHNNLKNKFDTDTFMGLCRSSEKIWGNKFTITLCTELELKSL